MNNAPASTATLACHSLDCGCSDCRPPASGPAVHPDTCTCDDCDPAGTPRSVFGDADGDWDADEILDALRCGDFEANDSDARF
jgi:hypothetical protein